jgi:pantoate--beta-alanine ligase
MKTCSRETGSPFESAARSMETVHTLEWMKQVARQARAEGRVIGLVPTMGALHEGHLSLVRAAQQQCSPVVVSIFVNPRQFGPQEDLARYPRRMEEDRAALDALRADCLFAPTAAEMYPEGFRTCVNVEGLSDVLEGRSRPGHFRGVATVVLKLLEIVQPHFAYFGRKDAQQARLIRQMVRDLNLDSEIVVCPIVREPDGLAMSSRNAYLKPEERRAATVLHAALEEARREIQAGERDAFRLRELMRRRIQNEPLADADYAEIVDADTFEQVTRLRRTCLAVMAVFVGATRLLDNMLIEEKDGAFLVTI